MVKNAELKSLVCLLSMWHKARCMAECVESVVELFFPVSIPITSCSDTS